MRDEKNGVKIWGRNELNPKNLLNELFQERNLPLPVYKFIKREGDDHNPLFWYSCEVLYEKEIRIGIGSGRNKKEAQKNAANELLLKVTN